MLDLPDVGRYKLDRPPLVQALGQVLFPVVASLQTLDGVAKLQEALSELFPFMHEQQVQEVSLLMGPGVTPSTGQQTSRSWRFTNDGGWTLVVGASAATLIVGPEYGHFGEFLDHFEAVVSALREVGLPRCERVGLRYLDIAQTPPNDPGAWKTWFRPELVGWPGSDLVASETEIATSISQTQLLAHPLGKFSGLPGDFQGIIRHGFVPANSLVPGVQPGQIASPSFLLDLDLFIVGPQPFDPGAISSQISLLHDQIDRFFRWGLTSEGEQYFGLTDLTR